jgi:hypothetical protein
VFFFGEGVIELSRLRRLKSLAMPLQQRFLPLARRIYFALQQTLLTPLLKGQWHFLRLLCIGAASMNGWEPRRSVVR